MDERPDEIVNHIEAQRNELGRNLNELETRVRAKTDWRAWFDRNPMMMVGVALGGGLLLGSVVGQGSTHRRRYGSNGRRRHPSTEGSGMALASAGVVSTAPQPSPDVQTPVSGRRSAEVSHRREQLTDTLDHIKDALIGFGIAKTREFLSQAIPGFDQHLDEAGTRHRSSRFSQTTTGQQSRESTRRQDARDSPNARESDMYRTSRSPNPAESGTPGSEYNPERRWT